MGGWEEGVLPMEGGVRMEWEHSTMREFKILLLLLLVEGMLGVRVR